jgi:hypothetical protein
MSMSDLVLEMEEQQYDDYALDGEQIAFEEALYYIEEFKAIVKNENDYADLLLAEGKIVEYQKVYVKYEHNATDETRLELEKVKQDIISQAQLLEKLLSTISISQKKKITIKDFEKLYSISVETQLRYRNRMKDPLPHIQIVEKGNILYDCVEVEKWLENYKK